jgi:hypothetical protein
MCGKRKLNEFLNSTLNFSSLNSVGRSEVSSRFSGLLKHAETINAGDGSGCLKMFLEKTNVGKKIHNDIVNDIKGFFYFNYISFLYR